MSSINVTVGGTCIDTCRSPAANDTKLPHQLWLTCTFWTWQTPAALLLLVPLLLPLLLLLPSAPAEVLLRVPHCASFSAAAKDAQHAPHAQHAADSAAELDAAVVSCEAAYTAELQQQAALVTHHVPLLVLARSHWRGVLLLFCLEACYGATFYTFFSW
jgi:hypothetical protein